MANTSVILREKIDNIGAEADVVEVRAGFARNFLIPQGKAYEASEENLKHIADLKTARAEREATELNLANDLAARIKKLKLKLELETGQGGKAFGAITNQDIAKKLEESGIEIDRHSIVLDKPIKSGGSYDIDIKLHSDISAKLTVNVETTSVEAAESDEDSAK